MDSVNSPLNNKNMNKSMIEITKILDNLKKKRDKLDQEIEDAYQLKVKIQQQLNIYGEQMQKLADNLEQKHILLNIYDKILNDSDSAYSKIIQSTQALYNKIKNEEMKLGLKNQ